ncbi:MAG: DUF3089 domain-containing protein [Bacteroidales bacterium]|nr:DUF3089 domain-containing protein [Candidatus Cacconaster merdequi]
MKESIKTRIAIATVAVAAVVAIAVIFHERGRINHNDAQACCEDTLSYNNPQLWYANASGIDTTKADVFYILPTCIYDWTDSCGTVHHHANVEDSTQRVRMDRSSVIAQQIFADSANFFSPYYRQISLDSWIEGNDIVEERFSLAMNDIRSAFRYYLDKLNNGRPFVLAGYSQGGKCVVELIKEMDSTTYGRMVAAYVCGYGISEDELDECPKIVPAQRADDIGTTIVFNTVTDTSAISRTISGINAVAINPASWSTDTLSCRVNDTVSVHIDSVSQVLIADGFDPASCYREKLAVLIPFGNLHLMELSLYGDFLKENVKTRLRAYRAAQLDGKITIFEGQMQ